MERTKPMMVGEILKPQVIARRIITCNICQGEAVLRLAIDFVMEDAFLFPCSTCGTALQGYLVMQDDPAHHPSQSAPLLVIRPDNFTVLNKNRPRKKDPTKVVTIQPDLPVHRTRHLQAPSKGGSPSLWLSKQVGAEYGLFQGAIKSLRMLRHEFLPFMKTLIHYAEKRHWDVVDQEVQTLSLDPSLDFLRTCYLPFGRKLAGDPTLDVNGPADTEALRAKVRSHLDPKAFNLLPRGKTTPDIIVRFYRTLELPFLFIVFGKGTMEIIREFLGYANDCTTHKQALYLNLLQDFRTTIGYDTFRVKVFDVYPRIFDCISSITTGLLCDYLPQPVKDTLGEYRVFRNDYAVVKGLYVDIFELIVQALHFLGPMVNLTLRNDPGKFCEIEAGHQTLHVNTINSFMKLTAYKKLDILKELPKLQTFIGRVSRPMRNDIGHFNAVYDYRCGELVYDDGTHTNYILFLNHLVESFRAVWFLLSLVEQVDTDMAKNGI